MDENKEQVETRDLISRGKLMEELVNNEGWKLAKSKLMQKLIEFDSVSGIVKTNRSFDDIGRETILREAVVEIIVSWIREIEGDANKSKTNSEVFRVEREESIVHYFGNE